MLPLFFSVQLAGLLAKVARVCSGKPFEYCKPQILDLVCERLYNLSLPEGPLPYLNFLAPGGYLVSLDRPAGVLGQRRNFIAAGDFFPELDKPFGAAGFRPRP